MISDPKILKKLQKEWKGVCALRDKITHDIILAVSSDNYSKPLSDMAHNLPFLHACGVLNNVLEKLRDQKLFKGGGKTLGPLLCASRDCLPWNDFALMKVVFDQRNNLAHNGVLVKADDCLKYVQAIEEQLVAWRIIG